MKKFLERIGIPLFTIIFGKIINDFKIESMTIIYQKFVVELWYVWTGLLVWGIYWFVKFLIVLNKSVKGQVSYEQAVIKITNVLDKKLDANRENISSIIKNMENTTMKIPPLMQGQIESCEKQIDSLMKAVEKHGEFGNSLQKFIADLHDRILILERKIP